MKLIIIYLSALGLAALPSCTESEASASSERPPENGAQFRKGDGLSLTDEMSKSIGLQIAEVTEQKISATVPITLRSLPGGTELTGWLTSAQAEKVQPGASVEISGPAAKKGTVLRLEKSAYAALGDNEVWVSLEPPLADEAEVRAVIHLPETEAVAAVPRTALLTTAEGKFVYARNGKFFLRTPVTVGAMSDNHVEISEGLYSGDEVVTSPVMSLWMAELQVLRGGKACTCGH